MVSGSGQEGGKVATLRVSMPASSRTALGDKVDGKYPVSWCEGDVLTVNGKPTTSITISEEDSGVAIFELPLGITIPYNIVYPYIREDSVESKDGKYPVMFLTEQQHTEGTFAPNSAPMYAWSNGFDDVHMEHLTSVIRLGIKAKAGESVDLKYVSISTVAAEPISGIFDVYCADGGEKAQGTLEAHAGALSTIFYSFEGDSYVISDSKEEYFYIALPKGEYTRFEVNFVNQAGEVYVETFDATGDKQLLPGKVREFPVVEFEANSKMFLIGNDVDMETFAMEVKAGTFNDKYDGALLVNDIDMTGKEWISLEGFTSMFEGRNYSIKGLTTPLFGENVVGTISNLRVEGTITESANGKVGIIARSLAVDGDKVGTIFNCSAAGSIVYSNPNITVADKLDLINVGGVVGGVYGGSVTLSKSDVNIEVTMVGPENEAAAYKPCVGGVVGYVCAAGEVLPVVVENENRGSLDWDDVSKSSQVLPYLGGVAGYVTAGAFEKNVNSGVLSVSEAMHELDWGGVVGASSVSISECVNAGSLTINEAITKARIGGVVGLLEAGSIVNSENSGKLLFDENFVINGSCNVGGVVAYAEKGTKSIENCVNSGSITYLGSCTYKSRTSTTGNANLVLGGVVGFAWSELIKDCSNYSTAVINVAGNVSGNGKIDSDYVSIDKMTGIAGVIGVRGGRQTEIGAAESVRTENCTNAGNVHFKWQYCGASYIYSSACIGVLNSDYVSNCKNDGSVVVEANVSYDGYDNEYTSTVTVFASGLIGYIDYSCDKIFDCQNTGSLEARNTNARMFWVSGVLGTAKSGVDIKLTNCANSGNIVVAEDVTVRNLYVGGILSNTLNMKLQYPNCYNSGTVESKAHATEETYLGSIFGRSYKSDKGLGTQGIENDGRVVYSGKSAIAYVGGYCGRYEEENHTVEFQNSTTGVVEFNGEASVAAFIGGIAGLAGGAVTLDRTNGVVGQVAGIKSIPNLTKGGEFVGMINNGNVTILGSSPLVYISGGFGYLGSAKEGVANITNNGTVTVPLNMEIVYPTTIYMGGVFGYANMNVTYPSAAGSIAEKNVIRDCHNTGNINYYGIARDGAYVGGLVGRAEKAPIYNCSNKGAVTSTGNAGDYTPKGTQAEDKHQQNCWGWNYHNEDLAIGGIAGQVDLDMKDCENNGTVTHTCTQNPIKLDHNGKTSASRFDVGGIAGRTFCNYSTTSAYSFSLTNLVNNGAVTIYGSPSATNNTASIDLGDAGEWQWTDIDDSDRTNKRVFYRVNVGGLIGRMIDDSSANVKHFVNGCVNNAAVSVPEAAGAKCLSVAGAVGELLISNADFNNVVNKGRVSIEKAGVGTTTSGSQFMHAYFINMGGLVATYFDCRVFATKGNYKQVVNFNDCVNDGDIHYGEIAASCYQCAGGMLGQAIHIRGDWCIGNNDKRNGKAYSGSGERYSCIDVHFNRCKNNGNIDFLSTAMNLDAGYNYNYAGGILGTGNIGHNGYTQHFNSVDLTFDHCENTGSIQWDRNNSVMSTNANPYYTAVGGIVGHHCGGVGVSTTSRSYTNNGRSVSTVDAFNAQIISCKNSGRIWGFSGYLGGIIGCGNWYTKITGTAEDPTINTGDIVVVRDGGKVVVKNRYGNKYMYAGGIAGIMREYINAAYAVGYSGNNSFPIYYPEEQYARIEYAVNEGAVGSTGYAGGIAGYYWSAVQPSKEIRNVNSHRGGLQYCRNTGDIYALEGSTTNVGSIVGMARMFTYTANSGSDLAIKLNDKNWQIGVSDCEVGGSVLRGAVGNITVDQTNYMQAIYGEGWADDAESVSDKPYDGCILYVPAPEVPETPEDGGDEGTEPEATRK